MDSKMPQVVETMPLHSPPSQPSQQLVAVPVAPAKGKLVLVIPRDKGDLVTNYRPDAEEDQIAVSRAMSPSDARLDVYVGKTIKVVGIVLNMAEFESQEVKGEMVDKVYASIVLEDGTIIGTTGKAVMGQLAYLIGAAKPGPFSPPVEFEVRSHKVPPPKQPYYSLRRCLPVVAGKGKVASNAK